MNLILCGMMGAGKTTVGKALAQRTGRTLLDTDALIVERYGNINDIFARYGEQYFRDLETQTVQELCQQDKLILSVGGGLVLKRQNVEILQKNGKIIYLRAKLDTLMQRLSSDRERPLLHAGEESLQDRLTRLLNERACIYEKAADFVVDVDEKTPEEIAEEIEKIIG